MYENCKLMNFKKVGTSWITITILSLQFSYTVLIRQKKSFPLFTKTRAFPKQRRSRNINANLIPIRKRNE